MDDRVPGWVFLPDDSPRMHRTDPTDAGHTLCGRHLDPGVPVLQDPRRMFSICLGCRDAGAQYPIPHPAPAGEPPSRKPQQRIVDGPRLGWVLLPKPALRVLHRPDPHIPDRVLCGLPLPGQAPIHKTPPPHFAHCDSCKAKIDADPQESRQDRGSPPTRAEPADQPRKQRPQPQPPPVSGRIRERLAARPVIGDGPTGTAGTWRVPVGWVRLNGRAVWHRRHPEQPDRVMCELFLPGTAPVYLRRVPKAPACPDCQAVHTQALTELRERDRLLPPPPARTTTHQPPRPRIVRGGLPTLGRDR